MLAVLHSFDDSLGLQKSGVIGCLDLVKDAVVELNILVRFVNQLGEVHVAVLLDFEENIDDLGSGLKKQAWAFPWSSPDHQLKRVDSLMIIAVVVQVVPVLEDLADFHAVLLGVADQFPTKGP